MNLEISEKDRRVHISVLSDGTSFFMIASGDFCGSRKGINFEENPIPFEDTFNQIYDWAIKIFELPTTRYEAKFAYKELGEMFDSENRANMIANDPWPLKYIESYLKTK